MKRRERALLEQAKLVLDFNWTGGYTKPGPRLYPHQWSWDSALISIGYSHYDQDRAERELLHLFDAQWRNGLLPQIVFNPSFGDYFPGPGFWHAQESPDAPPHHRTSGVVQPPAHATAVRLVYERARDRSRAHEFLERAYPHLVFWHDYLYRERDPEGEGLAYIRHPWESGMDNSPLWDAILQRLHLREDEIPSYRRVDVHTVSEQDRPTSAAYDRFAYLVRFFAERGYEEAEIREECPFLVQDVLFNSLLCRAEADLAELAPEIGEDPAPHRERARKTARAIDEKLWDEEHGTYLDYDLVSGRPIYVYCASNFLPLFAGVPDEERVRRMVNFLEHGGFGLSDHRIRPVPSYDVHGFGFSPTRYWRGPVWINIDWFLLRGLERYGYREHSARLSTTIRELCERSGFYEYFDPFTGQGHGSVLFSWSAALLVDVLLSAADEAPSPRRP
ncbi:Glucosidase YgjK [Rubrobacter xylanophilus DSM 9941]|uniref:amylo-alpha-1,6-glucosidase n=1 Tax=Rubrobacter xylanophilus TaxID=49319 RepID=UPI001C643F16|nr:trehalase family glycosidase [Rubrobacter xylanophilus]QYJ17231.1 Glucosidase YgjK [Rubrobacter xylanophilus DSM 9941]